MPAASTFAQITMKHCCHLLFVFLCSIKVQAQLPAFSEWQNLTTSGHLPEQVKIQHSNNNLDLAKLHDKYYLAFRTAPTHFASKKSVLYIVSSTDMQHWNFEVEIKYGCDLREPRFIVYHDTLRLLFFTGGSNLFKFEPREILLTQTTGNSSWTTPVSVNLNGFVPWRLRSLNDTLYLSAYYGKNLYGKTHQSNLRLFHSTNAFDWKPISEKPQIDIARAEEGEFIFDKDGNLFATVRLEGTGSLVCKADRSDLVNWQTTRSKYKYDSALLFEYKNEIYLISRRNLDGEVDKVKNRKRENQGRANNLIRYSITQKVTALFKLNKENLTLSHLVDFPSTGDCSYPAIAPISETYFLLMNYSSNIKGRKKNWLNGQFGKTYIYQSMLKF